MKWLLLAYLEAKRWPVAGRVRAFPVRETTKDTLQSTIRENVRRSLWLYTDAYSAYCGLIAYEHEAVSHYTGEYVRGQAHTNSIESFWALLKRGIYGTFHHISPKYLHQHMAEFEWRQNIRDFDTLGQMAVVAVELDSRVQA
ncbi:MAG: hypothetical protein M2R46_00267 [Verrucomicrobia subdivision 3 bacterium]|nr:hypothetical protein [Limisphaerales bacterium]